MQPVEWTRDVFAAALRVALVGACPGSTAVLRGSLAAGTADEFSDVDVLWTVPAAGFGVALAGVSGALGSVQPLVSLRFDPDDDGSCVRQLVFARFAGVPVWWRVDLEVRALMPDGGAFVGSTVGSEVVVSQVPWDPYESALQNALASIKVHARGDEAQAHSLLDRGFARVERPSVDGTVAERAIRLATAIAEARPYLATFATDVIAEAELRR